jgi:hypothetical protein
MSTKETPVKEEKTNLSPADKQKGIENHKTAAKHHEEAAKHHHDAAKHHEEGNHDKAAASAVKANGHQLLANDAQEESAKFHATKK